MDAGTIAAIVIASLTGLGIGITLIVLLVRGGFLLGRLFNLVEALDARVDGLDARIEALTIAVNDLRSEVQQSNQTLAALANHTHDTDGRTVFQVPPPANR